MRKLFTLLMLLSFSIGTWAGPEDEPVTDPEHTYLIEQATGTWNGEGPVVIVHVQSAGGLQKALAKLSETDHNGNIPNHLQKYQNSVILKIDSKSFTVTENGAGNPPTVTYGDYVNITLSDNDIAALASTTSAPGALDMQDLKSTGTFTFANETVKRVILPDGWGKDDVTAAGSAIKAVNTDFECALSQDGANGTLSAYLGKPGTLFTTMRQTYYDGGEAHGVTKLGTQNQYTFSLNNLSKLHLTGTPSARDFSGAHDKVKYSTDGHLVFDREADETSTEKDAGIGGTRQSVGTMMDGAIVGAALALLDLEDAIITDEHCSDLTISWSYSAISTSLKEVRFPKTSQLTILPADCLNGDYALLEELCIPGNIEVLKTRACYISTNVLRHIWTTGTTEHMVYDNGAYLVPAAGEDPVVDHYGHAPLESTVWNAGNRPENNPRYGTITLPEGLKLIESHNFTARSVSDVYVLSKTAPECHVDAFSTIMYLGNNTIDTQYIIEQGMVTRQAYAQSVALGEYIAFLHYPRECGTPDIQRYTDPTREYSVATTLRDGKGNVIYFPNQSELNRAYLQGTTGYVWYAWDSERIPDNGNNGDANSFKNCNPGTLTSHNTEAQLQANGFYTANTMTDPDKTDRSFYDVRLDTNGEPTLAQPSGLDWYYNTIWEGKQLYPQAETVGVTDDQGNPVMETVPVYDANGEIVYNELPSGSSYEGNYTRATEQRYVEAEDGTYCHQLIQDQNGAWTIGYSYTASSTGGWVQAPWDASGNTWTEYADYMANQYPGIQRYDRAISGLIKFTDQWNLPRYNISTDYVEYDSYTNDLKEYLTRYNVEEAYVYSEAQSGDPEPYYQMQTQQVQKQQVVKTNDYRGWHQFVLTAYATNDDRPITPVKFYQTDNDWWTVCFPYDLSYNDMIKFFGNGEGNIPYLSKLRYVVRDYDKEKITLMFSKNLMVYKEAITNPSSTDDYVHGVIDDVTKWSADELASDPIILHKGVPYLIKPNIDVNAGRSFDVYQTETPELYKRLVDAQNVDGGALETYIYKGEYTVPAYVIGENAPETTVDSKDFPHVMGPTFSYSSSDQITYGGKKVDARISDDYSYTFVGSFFLSVMPKDCYFLGWDSKKKCAAFWYNKTPKLDSYDWNNQTGIICPNFDTSTLINPATSLSDPAKWTFGASTVTNDNLVNSASGAKRGLTDMDWDGGVDVVVSGIGKINVDKANNAIEQTDVVYDMQGVRMNRPLNRLPKGVYIVNGKKYVVE